MTNIEVPEGFAFVPQLEGVNVALDLLNAADKVKAARDSVFTVSGGFHVPEEVAAQYAADQPAVEEAPAEETDAPSEKWTVAEIEEFAGKQEPPIELPDGKKADKLQAVLDELAKRPAE